jgi:cupin superfamily acireductone dioxygenase involved in methionine salvage
MVGVPEDECLALSDGWLTQYKHQMGLKQMKQHGKAGSVQPEVVEQEQHQIQELIQQSGFALQDIFNMDETGLFYA